MRRERAGSNYLKTPFTIRSKFHVYAAHANSGGGGGGNQSDFSEHTKQFILQQKLSLSIGYPKFAKSAGSRGLRFTIRI